MKISFPGKVLSLLLKVCKILVFLSWVNCFSSTNIFPGKIADYQISNLNKTIAIRFFGVINFPERTRREIQRTSWKGRFLAQNIAEPQRKFIDQQVSLISNLFLFNSRLRWRSFSALWSKFLASSTTWTIRTCRSSSRTTSPLGWATSWTCSSRTTSCFTPTTTTSREFWRSSSHRSATTSVSRVLENLFRSLVLFSLLSQLLWILFSFYKVQTRVTPLSRLQIEFEWAALVLKWIFYIRLV